jgi:hypothetical protein
VIAVAGQPQILVDQSFRGVAIIRRHGRQKTQGLGAEAFFGSLAGFAMAAAIGDFLEPVSDLQVDVGQVGEGAQRPETLA